MPSRARVPDPRADERDRAVVRLMPPERRGEGYAVLLMFRTGDPLVVDLVLWGKGEPSVHRTLLRSDVMRIAAGGQLMCGDVTIARASSKLVRLIVLHADRPAVAVLSLHALQEFLDATADLVPLTEEAETDAVNRALQRDITAR